MGFFSESEGKKLAGMQEMQVQSLGREDPLKEEKATHSGVPAREIPRTEEPGGVLQFRVLQRLRHD